MSVMLMVSKQLGSEEDANYAIDLLEESTSPTAKRYLYLFIVKTVEMDSREGMLLQARSILENYEESRLDEAMRAHVRRSNEVYLSNLRQAAQSGNEDAKWVIRQLAAEVQ